MRLIREAATPPGLDVHLLDLDADPTPQDRLEAQAPDEARLRAARLRTPLQRRRLLVREAAVRRLAAGRLSRPVAEVRLLRAPGGRPTVEGGALALSLSQSRGLALVALADGGSVGCDLEHLDSAADWRDALAAEVLTPQEADRLAALPGPEAPLRLFLEMWTLKEAGLKCLGVGLSASPRLMDTGGSAGPPDPDKDAVDAPLHALVGQHRPTCVAAVAWRFSN